MKGVIQGDCIEQMKLLEDNYYFECKLRTK